MEMGFGYDKDSVDISFSGFWSQGDGASFTCKNFDFAKFCVGLANPDLRQRIYDEAEHIVTVLLEGTDDMVQHLGRLAVNPAYEFEDAITNKKHLHKTYPAPKDWAYDLEIDIKPPDYDWLKTAWRALLEPKM
jgi:hypothetical protein